MRSHPMKWRSGGCSRDRPGGYGVATEAGAAIRDEAFVSLGLESVVAVHHPANAASGRVMEKLGMAFERDVVTCRLAISLPDNPRAVGVEAVSCSMLRAHSGTPA